MLHIFYYFLLWVGLTSFNNRVCLQVMAAGDNTLSHTRKNASIRLITVDTANEAKTDETKRIFRLLYAADGTKPCST